jgi:hypothetical protein
MRTVNDLRQALVEETQDLASPIQVPAIRRRARRRRMHQGYAAVLVALILGAGGGLATLHRGTTTPEPLVTQTGPAPFVTETGTPPVTQTESPPAPAGSVTPRIDPSFPATGTVIRTGALVGTNYELVVWFYDNGPDAVGISSGLLDRGTGQVRDLETLAPDGHYDRRAETGGFKLLDEVDDRNGGVLDYGLFIGNANRIVGRVGGTPYEAHLSRWDRNSRFVVYWIDHKGTPVPADSMTYTSGPQVPRFVAYDRGGKQLGTSDGLGVRRSDGGVTLADQPQVGDVIRTGLPLADGRQLVFWFVGAGDTALLKAGSLDPATGNRVVLKDLGVYHQPPFDIGFYHGWDDFAGPGGTHIMVGTYVGSAAKIVTGAPGDGVTSGFGRWTAHPELIVFWANNISTANYPQTAAVAYNAEGGVIGTLSFGG